MTIFAGVVGATGNVGRELLTTLAERGFDSHQIRALAKSDAVGTELSFGEDDVLSVHDPAGFDFSACRIAFNLLPAAEAKSWIGTATAAGCVVIDLSGAYALEPGVPLIVPEVNGERLDAPLKHNIIAGPSPAAAMLSLALAPLNDIIPITRVVTASYHSVSGQGVAAMDELFSQTRAIFVNDAIKQEQFPKQIAFNVIPHIGDFMEDGATEPEWRLAAETRKLIDPGIQLTASCVRVPVFIGIGQAVHVEFDGPIDVQQARAAMNAQTGLSVIDYRQDEGYVSPVEAAGEDNVYISRVREDGSVDHGLAFWCVGDNLRKGSALNAVQIAETLIRYGRA